MSNYLNCKKIDTAINRAKTALIQTAKTQGLYENFGQKEVRDIKDKFIDITDYSTTMNNNRRKLESFDNWCMNYSGR